MNELKLNRARSIEASIELKNFLIKKYHEEQSGLLYLEEDGERLEATVTPVLRGTLETLKKDKIKLVSFELDIEGNELQSQVGMAVIQCVLSNGDQKILLSENNEGKLKFIVSKPKV